MGLTVATWLLAGASALGCVKGMSGEGGSGGHTGGGVGGTTGGGAGGTGVSAGTGGNASGAGGSGTGGVIGTGGNGVGGSDVGVGGNADAAACQQASYSFDPKIPAVFVLVDRSGTEFTDATTGTYFTLRAAALAVIQQLQGQVRFGFGAVVGSHASGTCAPVFDSVPIDINNATAIATKYNALGPLLPFGSKADTPTSAVIPMVKAALQADPGTGQKYMLIVTDGETDFCDDGAALCPTDAMTYRIQDLYTAGIGSLVIGLPTSVGGIAMSALQNFANAGTGKTVALPPVGGVAAPGDVYNQCQGNTGWKSLWTAAALTTTQSLATYGTPGGTAPVFAPTSTSQQALADQLSAALSGVKSCTFDLSNVDGKSIRVDLTQLATAHVKIQGTEIPQNDTNGWHMASPTQLDLVGTACTTWRMPNNNKIDFQFPCESIIFE